VTDVGGTVSPWGEPVAPSASAYPMAATPPSGARVSPGARVAGAPGRPPAAAGTGSGRSARPGRSGRSAKRRSDLVERTTLVKLIPRTGPFARIRAAIVLAVIAVAIGFAVAATLSVIVWGLATVIHHAAAN
jgi:hypothetical protein